jgi:hypothetical protein
MPFNESSKILSLHELHSKIMAPFLELAEVEYPNDIWMREFPRDDDLPLESGYERGVGKEAIVEELKRDYLVVEAGIMNFVDRAHAACADLPDRSIPTGGGLREVFCI